MKNLNKNQNDVDNIDDIVNEVEDIVDIDNNIDNIKLGGFPPIFFIGNINKKKREFKKKQVSKSTTVIVK